MLQVAVSSFLQSNLQRGGKMSVGRWTGGKTESKCRQNAVKDKTAKARDARIPITGDEGILFRSRLLICSCSCSARRGRQGVKVSRCR